VEAGRSGVIRSVLCTTSVARIDPGIDEGLANAQAESGLDEIPGPCKLFKSTPNRSIESNRSSGRTATEHLSKYLSYTKRGRPEKINILARYSGFLIS
jgi:hypothetical protein